MNKHFDMGHPWHAVPIGKGAPDVVNAIVEIPKDSSQKYEVDKETGLLRLDRFLYSAVHYPGDYGFIPKTLWEDNDPLDIIILTSRPTLPMTLSSVRIIGVLRMKDDDELDDKLVGVHDGDPRYREFLDITDVPSHTMTELKHFFETYKELQGKKCEILQILSKYHGLKTLEIAIKNYNKAFKKKSLKKN